MSLFKVFNVAGSALNAQTIRLNTTASNLANAESVSGDASKVYRARHPVFQAMMDSADGTFDGQDSAAGVRVLGVVESKAPPLMRYAAGQSARQQGRLCIQFERQFDRRNDQHDFGQPLLRHQYRSHQHRPRPAAQNHFDGPLGIDHDNDWNTRRRRRTGTGTGTGAGAVGGTGSAPAGGSGSITSGATLGGTDFLTLMLAQLKNQDPTSPVDSNTFLNQLAQLSEVQGISSLNTSFGSLSSSLTSSQALQASSLLGHQALVNSGTAALTANGTVTGAVTVPQTSSQVLLTISDSSGALVRQINLGAQSAGLTGFTWDGKEGNGSQAPAGTYTLSAQYAGATKGSTAATTLVNGTVESVSMGAGSTGLTLNVSGLGSVPFSSVQQISN